MSERTSTRRGMLLSLGGLTASALVPATVGRSYATTDSQPSGSIPTFVPSKDDAFGIETAVTGWSVGAATGQSIETEQAARPPTDRATAYTTASSEGVGEFAQTAVIGTPFSVHTERPLSLNAAFEGGYCGALRAEKGSSVTVGFIYGVGPYDVVREAVVGIDGPPTFTTTTIQERTLFDQAVSDGEATICNPTAPTSLSVSIPEEGTYMAYARLTTSGEVGRNSSVTVDFSPRGPSLTEATHDQQKGFVFEGVRFQEK